MAYAPVDPLAGISPITSIDPVARHFPGSIRRFTDPVLGEGQFIYLPGVVGNIVGAGITFNLGLGTVALLTSSSPSEAPVAFSMAPNLSPSSWSWYQVSGLTAMATSKTPNGGDLIYASATPGQLSNNPADGPQIGNMTWVGKSAGSGLQYANVNP